MKKNSKKEISSVNSIVEFEDLSHPEQVDSMRNFIKEFYSFNKEEPLLNQIVNLKKSRKKLTDKDLDAITKLVSLKGLESGKWLHDIEGEKDGDGLIQIRNELIKEYNAHTPSQLIIVDRIVSAYRRSMVFEKYTDRVLVSENSINCSQPAINTLKELLKGIELGDRHLSQFITLLKALNEPKLKVNIKSNNTYIAEKQQVNINSNHSPPDKSSELNNFGKNI